MMMINDFQLKCREDSLLNIQLKFASKCRFTTDILTLRWLLSIVQVYSFRLTSLLLPLLPLPSAISNFIAEYTAKSVMNGHLPRTFSNLQLALVDTSLLLPSHFLHLLPLLPLPLLRPHIPYPTQHPVGGQALGLTRLHAPDSCSGQPHFARNSSPIHSLVPSQIVLSLTSSFVDLTFSIEERQAQGNRCIS